MLTAVQLVGSGTVFPLPGSPARCCFSGPAYPSYHGADDTWGPQKLSEIIEARHRGESRLVGFCLFISLLKKASCQREQAVSLSCPCP